MQIDWQRAKLVLDRIHLALRSGQYPFENMLVVQRAENLPNTLECPRDHSLFLFRAKEYMQGGNLTERSVMRLKTLIELYPELLSAEETLKLSERAIRDALIRAGLSHYETRSHWWRYNSEILLRYWGGDPRNILLGLPRDPNEVWIELCERMIYDPRYNRSTRYRGFIGTQEKVTSIVTHFQVDARLVPYVFCPPAIDIQQLRSFLGPGVIKMGCDIGPWKELREARDAARAIYNWYCQEYAVSPHELGQGVWYFSTEMCRYAPGNMNKNERGKVEHNGFSASHRLDGHGKTYAETCGRCFLSDLCRWCVPQAFHYRRKGGLKLFPRFRIEEEKPHILDPDLPEVVRCDKHRRLWTPRVEGICIGCGHCEEDRTRKLTM